MAGPETVGEAVAVETAATVDAAIEGANAQVAVAEATAEAIAAGALESERAARIDRLEQELAQWRERTTQLRTELEAMLSETAQGMASANGDALASLSERLDRMEASRPSESIPVPLDVPLEPVTVIEPNASGSGETSVTETVVTERPARRHRFL